MSRGIYCNRPPNAHSRPWHWKTTPFHEQQYKLWKHSITLHRKAVPDDRSPCLHPSVNKYKEGKQQFNWPTIAPAWIECYQVWNKSSKRFSVYTILYRHSTMRDNIQQPLHPPTGETLPSQYQAKRQQKPHLHCHCNSVCGCCRTIGPSKDDGDLSVELLKISGERICCSISTRFT